MGNLPSVVLDAGGAPHVSFRQGFTSNLIYAYRSSAGVWITEIGDNSVNVGESSIALDPVGVPHIAYHWPGNGDLRYATRTTGGVGGWVTEVADGIGVVGSTPSLAIDASGVPHIAYFGTTHTELLYATEAVSGWTIEHVDGAADGAEDRVGTPAAIALDSGGNPIVAYYDFFNGDLKFAERGAVSWAVSVVDFVGDRGGHLSIASDPSGQPHIAYYEQTGSVTGNLWYAHRTASGWQFELVDDVDRDGKQSSIAVDTAGNPHIAYYSENLHKIVYATHNGSGWIHQDVEIGIGNSDCSAVSLRLDGNGSPRIVYELNGTVKYARIGTPVGVNEWTERATVSRFEVSPNPVHAPGFVQFHCSPVSSIARAVSLFDVNGRKVSPVVRLAPDENQGVLDVSSLASGVYFLRLIEGNGAQATRSVTVLR